MGLIHCISVCFTLIVSYEFETNQVRQAVVNVTDFLLHFNPVAPHVANMQHVEHVLVIE